WDELLELHSSRQDRYHRPISVVSADLDELKLINDREGHPAGDAMIAAAAQVLKANTRAGDVVARVGGDEFLVLLTEADPKGAQRDPESWDAQGSLGAAHVSGRGHGPRR